MLDRIPQWKQRLLDLSALIVALLATGFFRPGFLIGGSGMVLALATWITGLSVMGHYKNPIATAQTTAAGKLLFDHAMLTGFWAGTLALQGTLPDLGSLSVFAATSFTLLALARVTGRAFDPRKIDQVRAATLATDTLIGAASIYSINGLWWSLPMPVLLPAVLLVGHLLGLVVGAFFVRPLIAWIVGQGLLTGLLLGADGFLRWPQTPWQIALGAVLIPALIKGLRVGFAALGPPPDRSESWRRLALGTVVFALLHPFCSAQLMGASDAKVYAEAMQDFLGQIRAGVFPVFVSQTEVAPFGSVFPFRMAFYHFHFGALLDLLSLRSLNVYAIQHLTLLISAAAGVFGLYFLLKRLTPNLPNECAAIAALYLASPVWLSTLYGLDMYFTAMTLPWLPLVFYAMIGTFQADRSWRCFLLLGATLAATWLAHPPVGFWASVCIALSQLFRLGALGRNAHRRDFALLGLGLGSCLLLSAGLFVSLADVRITGELVDPSLQVLTNLSGVVPHVFQPVSATADRLSDMQLGYAWQILLVAGILLRPRGRMALAHMVAIALAVGLLFLIYPVPGVTSTLWRILPWEVINITNVWPMQRLYPVVLALTAFVAIGVLQRCAQSRSTFLRLSLLATLSVWTGLEATKFLRRAHDHASAPEASRILSKIENSPLLSTWTAYTPQLPERPLVGHVSDPRLLNRLLDPKTNAEIISNAAAVAAASPNVAAIEVGATYLDSGTMRLSPGFSLEPGQRYQLNISFLDQHHTGGLQFRPLHEVPPRFFREIQLPAVKSSAPLSLNVWTSEPTTVPVEMLFRPADPAAANRTNPAFLNFRLIPYQPDDLPIKITSLAPYSATVEHPTASLLETHRFFARGYQATVNGSEVPVTESPDHRVMLPLGPGRNNIHLDYVGPPLVRAVFWISAFAWLALAGFGVWIVVQTRLARRKDLNQTKHLRTSSA